MRGFLLLTVLLSLCNSLHAQDWDRRHRFAKSYFGVSTFVSPSMQNGSFANASGEVVQYERSGFLSPAVNIGATHFWGHADFYISINTSAIKLGDDELENSIYLGTFTGLRVYPLPSKPGNIRPYLGYKFSPLRSRQTDVSGQKYRFTQVKSVFDVGLGWQLPNFYVTIEYGRVVNPSFDTYLSRTIQGRDRFPTQLLQIGLNYTIDSTQPANTKASRAANELFSGTNQYGFFFGIGPSAAFPIASSEYITEQYPFLDDRAMPRIFPDLVVGYHFTKTDLVTALSFRPMTQKREAYGFEQTINRNSLILEAYQFLGDYHGFAPYLGIGLSYENLQLSEVDNGTSISDVTQNKFSPAVVFGWDIRPSEKGDWWVLRTNLRYSPFLRFSHREQDLSLQHLEFNFIQFVMYPQRRKKVSG
ncbi:MAG: hypothetical protein AAFV95_21245 [Bacteroidota bacterium]